MDRRLCGTGFLTLTAAALRWLTWAPAAYADSAAM